MPAEVLQVQIVTRDLGGDVELADALGFPEFSAVEDPARKGRPILAAKAKAALEDPALTPTLHLHRRIVPATATVASVDVRFDPPKRLPAWEQPLTVRIDFVHWPDADRHAAYVPALGIVVFASRPAQLPSLVEEHSRLRLSTEPGGISLHRLAELQRIRGLRLESVEIKFQRRSPREAAASESASESAPRILEELADELPPVASARGGTARKSEPAEPAFELDAELREVAGLLSGNHRRSLLLVGPPGSGKSALVRELAARRAELGFGHTPFWSTQAARLMSGPIGFGMWQERCTQLCTELAKAHAILHLDNLSDLMEVGKTTRGGQSVGAFLRPFIARGDILAIAECTPEQFAALERQEPALAAAFQPWNLPPRSESQTRSILTRAHEAAPGKPDPAPKPTQAALDRLLRLHQRYASYSANPGRPVRFLRNLLADRFPEKSLAESDVLAAFSRETGLPRVLLDDDLPLDLEATRDWFEQRVIGQPEAAERVLDLLAAVKAQLSRPNKPLASFLFIGPTGTGKTEMAKALAEFLYGDASRLVRFDLNEFSDPVAVQRLIGGPLSGGSEGLLTARVREQPFGVLLLDEFEKADPSFFDLLLQLLGDGRLTDAAGRVADFSNSVVIMTSNLGAQEFQAGPVGFRADELRRANAREHFTTAVRRFLRPEIFNRIDAIVPYLPLDPAGIRRIVERQVALARGRDGLRFRDVSLELSDAVADHLARAGFDARYGARPLRRALERELLLPLAEALNAHPGATRLDVSVDVDQGRLRVRARPRLQPAPPRGGRPTPPSPETATAASATGFAERTVALRRQLARLLASPAVSRIDDEIALHENVERRAKPEAWGSSAHRIRLERLRPLRATVDTLHRDAVELETETLVALYRRENVATPERTARLAQIDSRRRSVARDAVRLHNPAGDRIRLAFHAEPREFLAEFAGAYLRLALRNGSVQSAWSNEMRAVSRKSSDVFERWLVKDPLAWTDRLPEGAWGLAVQLRGDLIEPLLASENGLHVFQHAGAEKLGWIRVLGIDPPDYEMPEELLHTGRIRSLAGTVRRTWNHGRGIVEDSLLGPRPFTPALWETALGHLLEDNLERTVNLLAHQQDS